VNEEGMSNFLTKTKVMVFLAIRPHYLPELLRRLRNNLAKTMLPVPIGRSRVVAEQWASECSVDISEVFAILRSGSERNIKNEFPGVLEEAEQRRRSCPVSMGGGGSLDLLYSLCESIEAKRVVETGVAYGYSSLAILLSISKRNGELVSVDMPYPGRGNGKFVGFVIPDKLRSYWRLYRYPDYIGLPKALKQLPEIDLCHYDSDKSYEGRAWAYPLLWRKLRSGGLFVSDDIGDNTAFRDFAAECMVKPIVVNGPGSGASGERYVGIMIKP